MIHFVWLAILCLFCCTPRAESPTATRDATLILGPNAYCGAARISQSRGITARHCVEDMICGTATDSDGNSVRCEVESLGPEGYDVAFIKLAPGLTATPMPLGRFVPGPVEIVSFKPAPFSRKVLPATFPLAPPPAPFGETVPLRHLFRLEGVLVPGESGSPIVQNGRIVGVVSISKPDHAYAHGTLTQ